MSEPEETMKTQVNEFAVVKVGEKWIAVSDEATLFVSCSRDTAVGHAKETLGGEWDCTPDGRQFVRRKQPPSDAERVAREIYRRVLATTRFHGGYEGVPDAWTEADFIRDFAPLIATVAEPVDELYKAALAENADLLSEADELRDELRAQSRANHDYWHKRFEHVRLTVESCPACHLKVIRDALAWDPGTGG